MFLKVFYYLLKIYQIISKMSQDRPSNTKAFALDSDLLEGASKNELYDSVPAFKDAKAMLNHCLIYATAYNETML
jgi:hypothetical protein